MVLDQPERLSVTAPRRASTPRRHGPGDGSLCPRRAKVRLAETPHRTDARQRKLKDLKTMGRALPSGWYLGFCLTDSSGTSLNL